MFTKPRTSCYQAMILCVVALFFVFPSAVEANPDAHIAPKRANYYLKWEVSDADAVQLARWDLVILDMEVQERSPAQLKRIRQLNPDIILLAYITPQEIIKDPLSSFSVMRKKLYSGLHQDWFLYDTDGKKMSWWPGTYLLNVSDSAPTRNGQRLNSYMATFVTDEILSTGYWDGIFYDNSWDNITYFAGGNIDYNRDGALDGNIDVQWRNGLSKIYTITRQKNPGAIILGNNINTIYLEELNGKLLENFSQQSWSAVMNTLKVLAKDHADPQVSLINNNTANTGIQNYQSMRYGLTSALLENVYYSYDFGDTAHNQLWWYDEYDSDLGNPIGDAYSQQGFTTYQEDVWRRDFEHGTSIVNSTNIPKTVDLGGDFEKLRGTQDPIVNDGSIVSQVSLNARDGLVLLKTFESLDGILYNNGDFVRFFRPDGTRVRNGFFIFDEEYAANVQIGEIDLNNNGEKDLIVVSGARIQITRDDGQPYAKFFPYTANYQGRLRVGTGDLDGDGNFEIFVGPEDGSTLPIRVYSRTGVQIHPDWYPFGSDYDGGYTFDVRHIQGADNELVIGTGKGHSPIVHVFTKHYTFRTAWHPYALSATGGVNVAAGDLDGDGTDEIVTGAGDGSSPLIRVFDGNGIPLFDQFVAFSSFGTPGIDVETLDVDFDGKEDIIGFSTSF